MSDDPTLLRRYATEGAEDAFTELVQRRFGLVYAVALRQVGGDEHLARDVAQRVFQELARQAPALSQRQLVSGWLYRTARFTAIDVVRAERRRRAREQEARFMQELSTEPVSDTDWKNLRPLLDHALSQLKERDRDVIMLRVFEDRSFAEMGRALQLRESAVRMCFERALDRLRLQLRRRGVTSTIAGLTVALANQAVAVVPPGLSAAVAGEALAGAKLAIIAGGLSFMSTTKVTGALAAVLAAIVIGVGTWQAQAARRSEESIAALNHDINSLRARRLALTSQLTKPADLPPVTQQKKAAASTAPAADAITAAEIERINDAYETNRRLRTTNPEYQQLYERAARTRARLNYAALYHALALTPDQIGAFEGLIAKHLWSDVDLDGATTALDLKPTDSAIKEIRARAGRDFRSQLQALLGPAGYEQFQQTENFAVAREMADAVAGGVYFTATPLTATQGRQLTQVIARYDPHSSMPGERWILSNKVDWNPILADARPLLSPAQLEALEGIVAEMRWTAENIRLLNQLRNRR